MRILHVTAQKPDSTGSGTYLAEVVAACGRRGHQQAVVCGIDAQDSTDLPADVAVYPVRFQTPEVPFPVCGMSDDMPYKATRYRNMTPEMVAQFCAAFTVQLQRAVAELQPDAIFCHHLYLVTTLVRELFPDMKVVAVSHSTDLRQMMQHNLEHDRIVAGIRGLDKILALHQDQKRQIMEVFDVPESQIKIIGTGYNAQLFNGGEEPAAACSVDAGDSLAAEVPERDIDLLFVGKICYKKGVVSLLRALEHIDASQRKLTVRLVGGMGIEEELRVVRQLLAESSHDVELVGRLPITEVPPLYRRAKAFVLPSFFEGLPLVMIEAMACGCKVLVTDLPGVKPWMEDCLPEARVEYVDMPRMKALDLPLDEDVPDFEERLAQGIRNVLASPAQDISTAHLSWDGLAQRLEQLL